MSSLRKYATIDQVQEFADITSTNDAEFEDRISQSEEMIDAYVGTQQKHVDRIFTGRLTSVSGTTLVDNSSDSPLVFDDNYFSYCVVEIIGGTGSGQRKSVTASSKNDKSITVDSAFTTTPDSTSVYKIYQIGKFPRHQDVYHDPENLKYYKSIPDAVMRAVCAQMAFIVDKGDAYFAGDGSEMQSESIGNYSYSRGQGDSAASFVKFVSPRARTLLRGYKVSGGRIIADNPTCL